MSAELKRLREEGLAGIAAAASVGELDTLETQWLGRKGPVTGLMRQIGSLPPEERPGFGQAINALKAELEAAILSRREALSATEGERRLRAEGIDVTRPGRAPTVGRRHSFTRTLERVADVMVGCGFEMVDGPEVEEYRYNFAALNYPREHPAMDEQMSFYVTDDLLLRTQTTALQGRVMPNRRPPFRAFTMGRCFRVDALDANHHHTFHQVDGFLVDRNISLADLKGTLALMMRELFGPETPVRFRPDFFPFVEPGAEIAIRLGDRWLELGGAGLIHPNVLRDAGIDPEEWSGFAFGLGLDRMWRVRCGIGDIRLLYENDLRLLRQF
jgi:phenylalanyl-tRNA synthetase alpha chain